MQHVAAQFGNLRPAAADAAGGRFHQRSLEATIHRVDQQPGTAVRHFQLAPRRRDRPGALNCLQQVSLARPDGIIVAEGNADENVWLDFYERRIGNNAAISLSKYDRRCKINLSNE